MHLLSQRNKAAMNELTVGQKVICKHKNGRYYQCDVVQLSKETFYEVNFDDGSFSDNLFPEDIVVSFTCLFFIASFWVVSLIKGDKTQLSVKYNPHEMWVHLRLHYMYTVCIAASLVVHSVLQVQDFVCSLRENSHFAALYTISICSGHNLP